MEHMQEMAKAYLDWWETYWNQTVASVQTMEDMQKLWASFAKTYEDLR
jgi:hypothetical protein